MEISYSKIVDDVDEEVSPKENLDDSVFFCDEGENDAVMTKVETSVERRVDSQLLSPNAKLFSISNLLSRQRTEVFEEGGMSRQPFFEPIFQPSLSLVPAKIPCFDHRLISEEQNLLLKLQNFLPYAAAAAQRFETNQTTQKPTQNPSVVDFSPALKRKVPNNSAVKAVKAMAAPSVEKENVLQQKVSQNRPNSLNEVALKLKKSSQMSFDLNDDSPMTSQKVQGEGVKREATGSPECVLESKELWEKFSELGTEMIITKTGRRMFPTIRVSFSGLERKKRYAIGLDVVSVDNKRYRYAYHRSSWLVAGKADPPAPYRLYTHPDTPALGQALESQIISFEKLKLTNNDMDGTGHIVLNSMHKYQPRIHLLELKEGQKMPLGSVGEADSCHSFHFPPTIFTAVTAYQNQLITKLKIDCNPFAKGFRDSSRLSDYERDAVQSLFEQNKSYAMLDIPTLQSIIPGFSLPSPAGKSGNSKLSPPISSAASPTNQMSQILANANSPLAVSPSNQKPANGLELLVAQAANSQKNYIHHLYNQTSKNCLINLTAAGNNNNQGAHESSLKLLNLLSQTKC